MSEDAVDDAETTIPLTEEESIESWRFEVLRRAGYRPELAERLARSEADLYLAVDLVGRGCPHGLAVSILV